MRSSIFRFKKFEIDQHGCAMKVNTDGVILGAMAENKKIGRILDIGTGTGLVALMLAQRFAEARIQALEIDGIAAKRAAENFARSPFVTRLESFHLDFKDFRPEESFDLIASNPPYFANSLKNPNARKALARHSATNFYDELIACAYQWLNPEGILALILPIGIKDSLAEKLTGYPDLNIQKELIIRSFPDTGPIRVLVHILKGTSGGPVITENLSIYEKQQEHSERYRALLKDFFLAF